jgi:hypothetical protein
VLLRSASLGVLSPGLVHSHNQASFYLPPPLHFEKRLSDNSFESAENGLASTHNLLNLQPCMMPEPLQPRYRFEGCCRGREERGYAVDWDSIYSLGAVLSMLNIGYSSPGLDNPFVNYESVELTIFPASRVFGGGGFRNRGIEDSTASPGP